MKGPFKTGVENVTDEELVKKFLRRDEEAISDAKKQYENYCMYIAQNVLSNRGDAEECVSDVLLAAWNSICVCCIKNSYGIQQIATASLLLDRLLSQKDQVQCPFYGIHL